MTKEIQDLVDESIRHPNMTNTIIGYLILIFVFILFVYGIKICYILLFRSPMEEARRESLRREKEHKK